MAGASSFQHLPLPFKGPFPTKFDSPWTKNLDVERNQKFRDAHVKSIRQTLDRWRVDFETATKNREKRGLPQVPAGAGFLIHIPENADPDEIAQALGMEMVAETEGGYLLVSSQDVNLQRLEDILSKFEQRQEGGGKVAELLEVFEDPGDKHRLVQVLTPEVLKQWPLLDRQDYIFDVSIQTAEGTHSFRIPTVKKRSNESATDFENRRTQARMEALAAADEKWSDQAEKRLAELKRLVDFYEGKMLMDISAELQTEDAEVIYFPDSFQTRVRLSGEGWRDIILNSPNIFEVAIPEDIEQPFPADGVGDRGDKPVVRAPPTTAPAVCVIDSGIQEGHLWLEPAIDKATSLCFIPELTPDAVQDDVAGGGHGTRVAGAVLYPTSLPRSGEVQAPFWIQNAKVLGPDNLLPDSLPAAKYIEDVVDHCALSAKGTRIFNHSIAANRPCPLHRMTAWATKIDEVSYKRDVLFIQASGNLRASASINNPQILEHLKAGRPYPDYLVEDSARIANPGQSLNALTVGSVCGKIWEGVDKRGFGDTQHSPSAFTRTGFAIWNVVKPEVVEVGGDFARAKSDLSLPTIEPATSIELIRATGDGGPAIARDGIGTSFAVPKVSHLAAILQQNWPDASALLYRGLIVHSARWPKWTEDKRWPADQCLRLLGYGLPDAERATTNTAARITFITEQSVTLQNSILHLYKISIPEQFRLRPQDTKIRIDVTLSYSSSPRRTRSSRRGYLATWLDWRSSGIGEPENEFRNRILSGKEASRNRRQLQWNLHYMKQHGQSTETQRGNGTLQKDWAYLDAHDLAEDFCIAVRAHKGWDHRDGSGGAKYCLIVSIEADDLTVPVYELLAQANAEVRSEAAIELEARTTAG